MKEPVIHHPVLNVTLPYSQAPKDWLEDIVGGSYEHACLEGHSDLDFKLRYAAILLAERGA